jgi:hypothetical protein
MFTGAIEMNQTPYIQAITREGVSYESENAFNIVKQMRLRDWEIPEDNIEFKDNVVRRIQMTGYTIIYWDATSFLMALSELGFIQLFIGGRKIVKEK